MLVGPVQIRYNILTYCTSENFSLASSGDSQLAYNYAIAEVGASHGSIPKPINGLRGDWTNPILDRRQERLTAWPAWPPCSPIIYVAMALAP